jgi:hypothetical protein
MSREAGRIASLLLSGCSVNYRRFELSDTTRSRHNGAESHLRRLHLRDQIRGLLLLYNFEDTARAPERHRGVSRKANTPLIYKSMQPTSCPWGVVKLDRFDDGG